jgi:hypothetical protein
MTTLFLSRVSYHCFRRRPCHSITSNSKHFVTSLPRLVAKNAQDIISRNEVGGCAPIISIPDYCLRDYVLGAKSCQDNNMLPAQLLT